MQFRGTLRATLGALALALLALARPASAFHDGGAAQCDGCHTVHRSASGGTQSVGAYLLSAPDPSSVCLNCHADSIRREHTVLSTNVVPGFPPLNFGPAGDFAWLGKSHTWTDAKGSLQTSRGENHGHNVVASQYGLARDPSRPTAPGGLYPSDKLTCISCHDPHGRFRTLEDGTVATSGALIRSSGSYGTPSGPGSAVGMYRLLGGRGYAPRSGPPGQPFVHEAPVAVAPRNANRSEATSQTRVAYGSGMSEWCSNCHGGIHTAYAAQTPSSFKHPSGGAAKLSRARIGTIYNSYVKTGDLSGSALTSYLSLVPFEEGTADTVTLSLHASSDGSTAAGPLTGMENVSCLSCHRAHASGWDHAMRWNQESEAIVVGGQWPGIDAMGAAGNPLFAQGRTVAETRAAMYDRDPRTFAAFQTSLCNKCHAK